MSHSPNQQGGQYPDAMRRSRYLSPHHVVLYVCFVIISGSFLLTPARSAEGPLYLGALPFPHTCVFKNLTGLPCPGCGLSRSMVAIAHGELRQSLYYHRLGLLTFLYVLVQFIYRIGAIAAPAFTAHIRGSEKYLNRGLILLVSLYLLNWIVLLIF